VTPQPISAEILDDNEKCLLYGVAGTGKTFAALTAPEPIYFMAIGGPNEAKTYFSKQFQSQHGKRTVFIDSIQENIGKRGLVKKAEGFDRVCDALDIALELDDKGEMEFATLVIDNATMLSAMQAYKVIEIANASGVGDDRKKKDSAYEKFQKSGILTLFDSDYKAIQSLMWQWTNWVFDLPKNVVFIAHEYQDTVPNRATQSQDIVGVCPQFYGRHRKDIPNMFDNVWRMSRNGQLYEARTEFQGKPFDIVAKTRVGGVVSKNYSDVNLSKSFKQLQDQARSCL